jgi:uroporphyrinogen decarboxylase
MAGNGPGQGHRPPFLKWTPIVAKTVLIENDFLRLHALPERSSERPLVNGISRVTDAIRHRTVWPIVRGEMVIDRRFALDFLSWQSDGAPPAIRSDADLLIACCRSLKLDLVCLQSDPIAPDESNLALKPGDIGRFVHSGLFVFWVVNGVFQAAAARRGMMPLLMEIGKSPREAGAALYRASGRSIAAMARGAAAGAHGIIVADDIAYRQNTFVSTDFVEHYLLPVWRIQVKSAQDLGVPVFLHSDGNLNPVLPFIVDAGFDGIQCLEAAAGMDIRQIKKRYGDLLCLMGSIDPSLLSWPSDTQGAGWSRDRLRRAVSDALRYAGDGGGFIFGTCSGLHDGMSPELVRFMFRRVDEQGTAI